MKMFYQLSELHKNANCKSAHLRLELLFIKCGFCDEFSVMSVTIIGYKFIYSVYTATIAT